MISTKGRLCSCCASMLRFVVQCHFFGSHVSVGLNWYRGVVECMHSFHKDENHKKISSEDISTKLCTIINSCCTILLFYVFLETITQFSNCLTKCKQITSLHKQLVILATVQKTRILASVSGSEVHDHI